MARTWTVLVATTILLATVELVAPARGGDFKGGMFSTPSGTIWCVLAGGAGFDNEGTMPVHARCDIVGGLKPRPPRPRHCPFDWGQGITLGLHGRAAVVCAGDTALGSPAVPHAVAAVGKPLGLGGISCLASRTGLRCTNRDRHGFSLQLTGRYRFF